jgi:hypothetical protein
LLSHFRSIFEDGGALTTFVGGTKPFVGGTKPFVGGATMFMDAIATNIELNKNVL